MTEVLEGTDLAPRILAGDRRALARAISIVEDGAPGREALVRELYAHGGRAYRVGFTGPPGAGKSTLVSRLVGRWRAAKERVGVVAVDPTSAFSGGALLGDRVRMRDHWGDDGVFIRSMATRGHEGGLSRTSLDAVDVLDAAGYDWVLLETVGVGQNEFEIAGAVGTLVVVLVPEGGDSVQAMKAGLLEVADVVVLNKSDRTGADHAHRALCEAFELRERSAGGWEPPVLLASAEKGEGVDEIHAAVLAHRKHMETTGLAEAFRRGLARRRVLAELGRTLRARAEALGEPLASVVESVVDRRTTPREAAAEVWRLLVSEEGGTA